MNYDEYEKQVAHINKENEKYLAVFQQALEEQHLSPKTIRNHVFNMDLYLNDYLSYEEPTTMQEGCQQALSFFTWFYPRKCLFSSKANAKQMMGSLRKFYKIMLAKGFIEKEDYTSLAEDLKEHKDEYLSCYDDDEDTSYFW